MGVWTGRVGCRQDGGADWIGVQTAWGYRQGGRGADREVGGPDKEGGGVDRQDRGSRQGWWGYGGLTSTHTPEPRCPETS